MLWMRALMTTTTSKTFKTPVQALVNSLQEEKTAFKLHHQVPKYLIHSYARTCQLCSHTYPRHLPTRSVKLDVVCSAFRHDELLCSPTSTQGAVLTLRYHSRDFSLVWFQWNTKKTSSNSHHLQHPLEKQGLHLVLSIPPRYPRRQQSPTADEGRGGQKKVLTW